jgi:hypothetical protein
MCTFKSERQVMVCDIAIGKVRAATESAFGHEICFTVVDGEGTLVEAPAEVDAARFDAIVLDAIAIANATSAVDQAE